MIKIPTFVIRYDKLQRIKFMRYRQPAKNGALKDFVYFTTLLYLSVNPAYTHYSLR